MTKNAVAKQPTLKSPEGKFLWLITLTNSILVAVLKNELNDDLAVVWATVRH